jgi:hypothetical protein
MTSSGGGFTATPTIKLDHAKIQTNNLGSGTKIIGLDFH